MFNEEYRNENMENNENNEMVNREVNREVSNDNSQGNFKEEIIGEYNIDEQNTLGSYSWNDDLVENQISNQDSIQNVPQNENQNGQSYQNYQDNAQAETSNLSVAQFDETPNYYQQNQWQPVYNPINYQQVYSAGDMGSNKKQNKKKGQFTVKIAAAACAMVICLSAGYIGGTLANGNAAVPESTNTSSTNNSSDNTSTNSSSNTEDSAAKKVVQTSSEESAEDSSYSVSDIAEMTANSVVEITTETVQNGNFLGQYVSEGAGSGVVISADGYIITNNHVIDGASNIKVKLKDDDKEYTATLVGTDAKTDIAVIKIDATGLQPAVFGNSDSLKVGEEVVAIGNPLGSLGGTVTDGIISALDREIEIEGEAMTLLQTNAAINPGNSGGGLFNMNGELVGVVNAKSSGSDIEGLGFAIPANVAKEVAESIMNYGYVKGRVGLGMTLIDITDTQTAMTYRVQKLGVYVWEVENSGSAKDAGIESGDCILSADGQEIESYADFTKIIDSHKIGDTIEIVVYRNRQNVTCTITLQEYKP